MKPHIANLINAGVLILMSAWGYLGSETPSVTALIPAIFGVILLVLTPGVQKENKVVAHIAVVLTLLIIFALVKPFMGAMGKENNMAMFRIAAMMTTSLIAMVAFVRSFIAAKKARG